MNQTLKRSIQSIAIIVVVLLVLNFGYQIWTKMHPTVGGKPCDIQTTKTCTTQMNNGQAVNFSVSPRPIREEQSTIATITLTNIIPDKAQLLVYPVNNNLQPQQLFPLTFSKGVATVTFTVLSGISAPKWVALVTLQMGTTVTAIPFRFVLPKNDTPTTS